MHPGDLAAVGTAEDMSLAARKHPGAVVVRPGLPHIGGLRSPEAAEIKKISQENEKKRHQQMLNIIFDPFSRILQEFIKSSSFFKITT